MMLFIFSPAFTAAVDGINIRFHTCSIRTPANETDTGIRTALAPGTLGWQWNAITFWWTGCSRTRLF
ncbi:hypothetical protein [Butyricicoccus sp. Marseille-Q5471]|uniref:hypothetical protein n=1 Tax=Butyricicoccus sp. Marseille-Q5471 TaxID=3039493 RepID=UPI003FA480F5